MNPPAAERRAQLEGFWLLAIVAGGVAFRVSHAFRGAFWRDEAQFLNIVALPSTSDMIRFLSAHESHPPLYYLLMRAWTAAFGTSDTALLLPGLALGALTILVVWQLGRVLESPAAGWAAAALVACSPGIIESDGTARPYTFLALLLLVAVSLLHRALETGRARWLAGWVVTVAAILYTHNWGLLPVAAMSAGALWAILRRRTGLPLRPFLIANGALAVLWLPWLPSFGYQARHAGQLPMPRSPLVRGPLHLLTSVPGTTLMIGCVLAFGLVAVLLLRRRNQLPERPAGVWGTVAAWVVLGSMALATAGSWSSNLLVRHTLAMLTPLTLLAVALVLTQAVTTGRALSRATLAATLALNLGEALRIAATPRSNVDVVAREVTAAAASGDLILLVPGDLVSSFARSYTGAAALFPFPDGSSERPIAFDDRIARETNPGVTAAAAARVESVLQGGGKVYAVAVGVPQHLARPWQDLADRMRALGAVSREAVPAEGGARATRENAILRVWATPASTPGR